MEIIIEKKSVATIAQSRDVKLNICPIHVNLGCNN